MKTILLIITLLLPAMTFAGGRHGGGYSHYGGSPGSYSEYRCHYRGGYSAGQGFDFSAYPTGGNYSPDPPDFHYQSITPGGAVEGVHTWADKSGTVHFTDDPGKAPRRR
jgi:hypothetical protein